VKNTQIYPVVKIGDDYFSTNNTTFEGNYCKPILLNIPSIKQSVDIESRKFKISNVSLDLSNFPVSGERFSDRLSTSSLINTEVVVYFVQHDTFEEVYKGQIRRISHDDEKVKIELEDLTEQKAHRDLPQNYVETETLPDKHKNKPIPIVYGNVDRSPLVFDIDESSDMLLIADENDYVSFENGDSLYIHESDKYLTIPQEAKSPLSNTILWDDSESFSEATQYSNEGNFVELNSKITDADDAEENDSGNAIGDGKIIAKQKEYPTNFTALKTSPTNTRSYYSVKHDSNSVANLNDNIVVGDEVSHSNMPLFIRGIMFKEWHGNQFDDDADEDLSRWQGQIPSDIVSDAMWKDDPAFDNSLVEHGWVGAKIDFDINDGLGEKSVSYIYPHIKSSIWNLESWFGVNVNFRVRIGGNKQGDHYGSNGYILFSDETFEGEFNIDTSGNITGVNWLPDLAQQPTIDAITGDDDPIYIENPRTLLFYMKISNNAGICAGQTEFIDLYVETYSLIKGVQDKEYYGDIKGRINTLNDHPCVLSTFASENDPTFSSPILQLGLPTNWVSPSALDFEIGNVNFLENPIDIIYDILRVELNLTAEQIDLNDFAEARKAHEGWVFGFTVDKNVNSKKLIQEIAKSTKCFPKFRNDGTFGFNTIKDTYTQDDIDNAIPIKEEEVINYSFKKTKPEDIVSEVGVKYKKDYAQDSYLKDVFEYIGSQYSYQKYAIFNFYFENWEYYGIENPEDAFLEIESDYIRDDETAHKLREFLFNHHKNDHLIFNVKLPISYNQLEVGDLVKFDKLFGKITSYGIDYTQEEIVNGQTRYPLFMIISTKKNLDSIEIECMQLHLLDTNLESELTDADTDTDNDTGTDWYAPDEDGDVNGDGAVNILDVVAMVAVIQGNDYWGNPEVQAPLADINDDGVLDVLDVVGAVLMIYANN
tara:strand:- start:1992 stop:4790 length:2799 start_codon:yes stop_codon:yes gene_type:complete